jgi:hypothetical protein
MKSKKAFQFFLVEKIIRRINFFWWKKSFEESIFSGGKNHAGALIFFDL